MFHLSKNWAHSGWLWWHSDMLLNSCVLEFELSVAVPSTACSCTVHDGDWPPPYRSTHDMFHLSKNWAHLGWFWWHSDMLLNFCVLEFELSVAVSSTACSCTAHDGDWPPPYNCTPVMFHFSKNWAHLGWLWWHSDMRLNSCVLEFELSVAVPSTACSCTAHDGDWPPP